ncbi:MAG: hypothetical protein WD772_11320 [Pseudohongiellaceae bacterium]
MSREQPDSRQPTMDGEPVSLDALLPPEKSPAGIANNFCYRWYRNISLFLAGMYTGVKCHGVPHDRHSYDRDPDDRPF